MITLMTVLAIATQKPMHEFVGQAGCQFYWGINLAWQWLMAISGLGIATYRLICFHYLFKRELNTKKISHLILLIQVAITTAILSIYVLMYNYFGWEKAMFFQFCMNLGTAEVNTILEYTYQEFQLDNSILKTFRFICLMSAQALFIAELGIYAWILYNIWKHN